MATGIYKKTNNPVATYGENSAAVSALQTQLNTQNAGKAGYTPLVVDGKYGDLTKAAAGYQAPPDNTGGGDAGLGGEYYSRMSGNEKSLRDSLTNPGPEPSLSGIRSGLLASNQALVDSIRSQYQGTINEEMKAGALRNDRGRALNVSANLAGSDFATANASKIEDENKKVIQSIEQERDDKIAAILAGVEQRATELYTAERDKYRQNSEDALKKIGEFKDQAFKDIEGIVGTGVTADKLKTESPDTWKMLLEQTGLSDAGLTAHIASLHPSANEVFKEKVGNTMVFGYRDPKTGKITTEKVPLAEGYSDFKVIDGKPYFIDTENGKIQLATGYQGGSSTTNSTTKFADKSTETYYKALPASFRTKWEYGYGIWGNPKYKTTFDDLQKDYQEWQKNNEYVAPKSGIGADPQSTLEDL